MRVSFLLSALLLAFGMPAWAQSVDPVTGAQDAPAQVAAPVSGVSAEAAVPGVDGSAQAATPNAGESAPAAGDHALSVAGFGPAEAQSIRQHFEARFPGIQVTLVRATPMAGIYEVQVGMDLLYTDASADYVLQGSLIDARARKDLTAERVEALQRVAFGNLPLDKAIKQVRGDGSRKVAVFEDPNCGYCKQLHKTLREVDNVTIYTFLFPILTADSTAKSRNIWCAADPAQAWRDWMIDGKVPAAAECGTPIQDNLTLGRKLNVQGTPALFFADGTRADGALPLDALKKKLDSLGG
uniref:DsbC family protein n=1 Tax=Castellaniella defragrans TaxID=75697 RepID=UPI003340B5FC